MRNIIKPQSNARSKQSPSIHDDKPQKPLLSSTKQSSRKADETAPRGLELSALIPQWMRGELHTAPPFVRHIPFYKRRSDSEVRQYTSLLFKNGSLLESLQQRNADNEKSKSKPKFMKLNSFKDLLKLHLPSTLLSRIEVMGYKLPTEVQSLTLPVLFSTLKKGSEAENRDALLRAPTGTGKSLVVLLPALSKLLSRVTSNQHWSNLYLSSETEKNIPVQVTTSKTSAPPFLTPQLIILVPTAELALQHYHFIQDLQLFPPSFVTLLWNGIPLELQLQELKDLTKPQLNQKTRTSQVRPLVLVATPKRMLQILLLEPSLLDLHDVQTLVIDEVDQFIKLLPRHATLSEKRNRFRHPTPSNLLVNLILENAGKRCQLLCCSATLSNLARSQLARRLWLKDACWDIRVDNLLSPPSFIQHYFYLIEGDEEELQGHLSRDQQSVQMKSTLLERQLQAVLNIQKLFSRQRCVLLIPEDEPLSLYLEALKGAGVKADALYKYLFPQINIKDEQASKQHGLTIVERTQKRKELLNRFNAGDIDMLILTHDTCRGLHFASLPMVIIIAPPTNTNSYIHLAGRTGRMGEPGTSVAVLEDKHQSWINFLEETSSIRFNQILDQDFV